MAVPKPENKKQRINDIEVLQRQLQFSKRLNFITNKINSSRDIDDILINLSESILSLFDAGHLTIYIMMVD
jgi:hypothetical protein